MPVTLPELPFAKNALEPAISSKTLEFHHGKHHKAYVDTTNELIKGTDLENADLETIIRKAFSDQSKKKLFNQSAQVWNHNFFWKCLKPGGGGKPSGAIAAKIDSDFGGYEKFASELIASGKNQFASGWAWLVLEGGKLKIMSTSNAENPLSVGKTALLTIDVWEHAYYLDYQNRRPDFLQAVVDKLINWDFVNSLLP